MTGLAIRLGARAAFARQARGRLMTGAAIGAVGVICLLVAFCAVQVNRREQARFDHLSSIVVAPGEAAPVVATSSYRGRSITFLLVPERSDVLPRLGLGPSPSRGEMRLSAALADRLDRDRHLRTWFPYLRGPDLPRDTVATAGEYTVAIGVDPTEYADAFGGPGQIAGFKRPGSVHYVVLGSLLFVAAPGAGVLALAGRIGRRVRRERFGALRLLGLPVRHCRIALGLETMIPVAVAAAFVALVIPALVPDHVVLPIVGRWVFGADARPGLGPLVLVVTGTALGAAAAGALSGSRRTATGRLRERVAQADTTPVLLTLVYALGLAASVWALVAPKPQDPMRIVSVLLVCVGLPGAVASVSAIAASALGRREGSVPWLLAMRKLAADPRSFARVAGMVGVVLFAVAAAQPLAQLVVTSDVSWVRRAEDAGRSTVLGRSETAPFTNLALDGPPPSGTEVALPAVGVWTPGQPFADRPTRTALVGSCEQARQLFQQPLPDCTGAPQALRMSGDDSAAGGPGEIRDVAGRVMAVVDPPASALVIEGVDVVPSMLVPPSAVGTGGTPFTGGVYLRVEADTEAFVAAQGWVTGSSPLYRLVNEYSGFADAGSTGGWLLLGFATTAGIALVAAVLVASDEQRTSGEWAALRSLGVQRADLVRTRAWIAVVSAGVTVVLATAPALALAFSFARLVDDPLSSYRPFVVGPVVAVLAIGGFQIAAAIVQVHRLDRGSWPR